MIAIIIYLFAFLLVLFTGLLSDSLWQLPEWYMAHVLVARCALVGGIGGVLYCMRGIYRNRCIHDCWDPKWRVWYYLRPPVSVITGAASYLFLRAGLLVLDAASTPDGVTYGYLALAFIAGYNVDNFLKKLEAVAESVWGVGKSRVGENKDAPPKD